uniref:Cytochrome c oxidase subunit 3 n=1 Tax=Centrorhynchus clitorideus TaxID=2731796 RepID=A0A6M3YWM7_9BILA|nr:cytochrome c oxidase subunit 3 [Centrorhynchus clitorideus]
MVVVSGWPIVVGLGVVVMVMGFSMGVVSIFVIGMWVGFSGLVGWVGEDQVKGGWEVLDVEGSLSGGAMGVLVFIFMESCFFMALVASSVYSVEWWDSGEEVDMNEVPLLISLVLLSSGVSVTLGHQNLHLKKLEPAGVWIGVTVAMGFVFVVVQYTEWSNNWFGLVDGLGGSLFYLITGFHGMHVVVGIVLNFMLMVMVTLGGMDVVSSWKAEGVIWYWHFVDVVWLFVLLVVYWYCM